MIRLSAVAKVWRCLRTVSADPLGVMTLVMKVVSTSLACPSTRVPELAPWKIQIHQLLSLKCSLILSLPLVLGYGHKGRKTLGGETRIRRVDRRGWVERGRLLHDAIKLE